MQRERATVHDFQTGAVIDGATAGLTRNSNGLSATLSTRLPVGGNAMTLWWIIFNNPAGCTGGCGPDEIGAFVASGGTANPSELSVLNADGRVVPSSGRTTFSARLNVGSDGPGEVLIPGGVTNPRGAEVHLLVVDHLAASPDPDIRWLQTHALTWEGACPNQTPDNPFGDCVDTQFAVFPAP